MKVCISCGQRFSGDDWKCPSCSFIPDKINGCLAFAPALSTKSDGYNNEFFEKLYDIESGNFWFRSRNRLITWALQKYFPDIKNFLEIGCGTGYVLSGIEEKFPGLSLFGSDIYCDGLEFCKKRLKRAILLQMDAGRIPFEDEFDLVGAFDVLEHINDDMAVIRQMYNSVKPGGGVIITVPQHPSLWSSYDEYSCHARRYTASGLKNKIEEAGFELIRTTSFISLLLPIMILSRIRYNTAVNRQKSIDDVLEELKCGSVTNFVLEKMLDIERYFLAAGVNYRLGGSLLLIGRKRQE